MMLRTEKLCKRLDSFYLRDISLEVAQGEYYVLLGRSGAGKTQLLEVICGLTPPDKGKIFLDGEEITRKKVQDRGIGLVFQDLALFPHYSVQDNIMYPLKLMKMSAKERVDRVRHAADQMNITDLLHRKPGNLSGGRSRGWRWRGHWSLNRRYFSLMSRWPPWMPASRTASGGCCAVLTATGRQ
jgi:molybdate/tungstate transport system ATP-binding protein